MRETMPFDVDPLVHCAQCPAHCLQDRRVDRVRNRETNFRLLQSRSSACTFEDIVPGTDFDPEPGRSFEDYLAQMRTNVSLAGQFLYGPTFSVAAAAVAKVQGDMYQTLQAAALWNATSAWNQLMQTGIWTSTVFSKPSSAVPVRLRKIAVFPLPRGYDSTRLFRPETRGVLLSHENALRLRGMELGMSSPDIVGVRLPETLPPQMGEFMLPLQHLRQDNATLLENAYTRIEGTLEGHHFLFAISTKRSIRSDRLYQPLFEANVLKYLIQEVIRGAAFKFYAHVEDQEGADAARRYLAPSLASLMRGGEPSRAVDRLYASTHPRDTAQSVLDDFPLFIH